MSGGLGNQIFQYIYGLSIAKNLKQDLYLDISGYQFDDLRNFELDKILDIEKSTIVETGPLTRYVEKMLFKVSKYLKRPFLGFVQEISLNYQDNKYDKSKSYIISGYWQNEEYFKGCFSDFLVKLNFPEVGPVNVPLLNIIKAKNSVGIHVRRGDYEFCNHASEIHGGVCNEEYYERAINFLNSKTKVDCYVIFSDDINWCKNEFEWLENALYCDSTNSHFEDLELMSKCKHNIIANSSFSWWSAYINSNKNKIVVAPSIWFNKIPVNMYDIVPDSWVKL